MSIDRSQFRGEIDQAIRECQGLSFKEKAAGIWDDPSVLNYFAQLSIDEVERHLIARINALFPDNTERRILILGGGTGRLGRTLAARRREFNVVEIDSSEQMVNCANSRAETEEVSSHFRSKVADVLTLDLQDGEFDCIIAHGLIRYLDDDKKLELLNAMRSASKREVIFSEGVAKRMIYNLKQRCGEGTEVVETEMDMVRVSLFYMLLRMYKRDVGFRDKVDASIEGDQCGYISALRELAGTTRATLFELRAAPLQ